MKKVFFFAVAAATLVACSESLNFQEETNLNTKDAPINFDVYAQRTTTRAGLPGGTTTGTPNAYGVTTATLQTGRHATAGFGVFAYFTDNGDYDANTSTPNFMYNEQVTYKAKTGSALADWTYEPVKYWPNEYGDGAQSDDLDKLTFFAYAPWVDVTATTGTPITKGLTVSAPTPPEVVPFAPAQVLASAEPYASWTLDEYKRAAAQYGLTVQPATASSADDITNKQDIVDKVTGYDDAARTAYENYVNNTLPAYHQAKLAYDIASAEQDQKINITQLTKNSATGDPMIKYVVDFKPATSVDLLWGVAADDNEYKGMDNKTVGGGNCFIDMTKQNDVAKNLKWNFKHALAMLNVQICTVVDKGTPGVGTIEIGTEGNGTVDTKTKVWLRSISFGGFATQGALNLHSEDAASVADAVPNWKDYDGTRELTFGEVTLYDGLKDGKEGTTNNLQKNEKPQGLNPKLIQQDATSTGVPITLTNLFYGETANINTTDVTAPIYVIPSDEPMDITVVYDIETEDPNLAGILSDGKTHGSSIQNKIKKENIFSDKKIEPGKMYTVKIYLGIESVKFDVEVTEWADGASAEPELPANGPSQEGGNISGNPSTMVANAYAYNYPDGYTYNGSQTAQGNNIEYTPSGATDEKKAENMMDDLARFLGALYRAGGVTGIQYGSKNYEWYEDLGLKGSNWVQQGQTSKDYSLVHDITAAYKTTPSFTSLTITVTTSSGTENIVFTILQ